MPGDLGDSGTPHRPRKERSLLARALAFLARREYSRAELARKLSIHARSSAELGRLLDDLEAKKLLSNRRFAESLARGRGERFGAARIAQELKRHGIDAELQRATVASLKQTELARARDVWKRKFGARPTSQAERARQMRFLLQRGFAGETVRHVIGGAEED